MMKTVDQTTVAEFFLGGKPLAISIKTCIIKYKQIQKRINKKRNAVIKENTSCSWRKDNRIS